MYIRRRRTHNETRRRSTVYAGRSGSSGRRERCTNWRSPGPSYHAEDIFIDHGSRHFQDVAGRPALVKRLGAWLEMWGVGHLIIDSSGVGEGVCDWLSAVFPGRVSGYAFQGSGKKASLGSAFLSLVETGRFRYWGDDAELPGSDGWWFWRQAEGCGYAVPAGGRFERDLRWEVPPEHRTAAPEGSVPTHDDRLLSAALVALADELARQGKLTLGSGESAVIRPEDPLADLSF